MCKVWNQIDVLMFIAPCNWNKRYYYYYYYMFFFIEYSMNFFVLLMKKTIYHQCHRLWRERELFHCLFDGPHIGTWCREILPTKFCCSRLCRIFWTHVRQRKPKAKKWNFSETKLRSVTSLSSFETQLLPSSRDRLHLAIRTFMIKMDQIIIQFIIIVNVI